MAGWDLVIFDNDGVLVDSERLANQVLADLLTSCGRPTTLDEAFRQFLGGTITSVRSAVEAELGSTLPADFEGRYHEALFAGFRTSLCPIPGVIETLDALNDAGVPSCVASSGTHERIRLALSSVGLLDRFPDDRIFSAEDVDQGKPAPDLFLRAASRLGARPGRCVVIEDSPAGVAAARAAGMTVVGFAAMTPPDRLAEADAVVTGMTELRTRLLRYGSEPAEEDELRRWLLDQGATAEQVAAAGSTQQLVQMASDLELARGDELSARDLADRLGVDCDEVVDLLRSCGVIVSDLDLVQFSEVDAQLAHLLRQDAVVDSPDGRALMRVVATALDQVAEAAVALYRQGSEEELERSGARPLAWAQEATRMAGLARELGVGMGAMFRHQLRQAISRQRVSQAAAASRDVAWQAVGFVDLVGSTALAETLDVRELRAVVAEFEARAFEVASSHGGRVVKFIGDEIMVAALDPASGCRLTLALVEACCMGGMQPRGGLAWGEVLFRGGDYYGRQVNLASRLAGEAIPGEVLVDNSVVDAVGPDRDAGQEDRLLFEPAGRRMLKGFIDPVPIWSVAVGETTG